MALIAATAASSDGAFIAPTLELGAPRKVIGPFISAQAAAQLRALMRSVVEGGTAAGRSHRWPDAFLRAAKPARRIAMPSFTTERASR